jgi:hypothetical protein
LLVCLFRSAVYKIPYLCIKVVGYKWVFLPREYFETSDRKKMLIFEVLTAMAMKIAFFCDIIPFSLIVTNGSKESATSLIMTDECSPTMDMEGAYSYKILVSVYPDYTVPNPRKL